MFKVNNRDTSKVWNMFKVTNKNTSTTSPTSFLIDHQCLIRSNGSQVYHEKAYLRNFVKFTRNYLCCSLFLVKLQTHSLQVLKWDAGEFWETFQNSFFTEHLQPTAPDLHRFQNPFLVNPLSANPTKWSNTLKQFVGNGQWTVRVC